MKSSIGTTFAWELHSLDSYLIQTLSRGTLSCLSLRFRRLLCFLYNTMAGFFLALFLRNWGIK